MYTFFSGIIECNSYGYETVPPSITPPPHRGAARQMYGSGQLRQPGSHPIYVQGHRPQYPKPSTDVPPPYPHYQNVPIKSRYPTYPMIPIPIPMDTLHSILRLPPELFPETRAGKNIYPGKYGGRPEFAGGIPIRALPMGNFENGFSPRGYPTRDGYLSKGDMDSSKPIFPHNSGFAVRNPEADMSDFFGGGPYVCPPCMVGQFQCQKKCDCISMSERCDGQVDCIDSEDEQNCEQHLHRINCDNKTHILCPKTAKCIKKEWLCDGDDDCGDFSDETHCGNNH